MPNKWQFDRKFEHDKMTPNLTYASLKKRINLLEPDQGGNPQSGYRL